MNKAINTILGFFIACVVYFAATAAANEYVRLEREDYLIRSMTAPGTHREEYEPHQAVTVLPIGAAIAAGIAGFFFACDVPRRRDGE